MKKLGDRKTQFKTILYESILICAHDAPMELVYTNTILVCKLR